MTEENPSGWVKPQRARSVSELQQRIDDLEAELRGLKNELFNLENGARLEAVAQIRNIMRAQQLTLSDIAGG